MRMFAVMGTTLVSSVACSSEETDSVEQAVCTKEETKLRDCGLLTPGTWECGNVWFSEACADECISQAACGDVATFYCGLDPMDDPVLDCLRGCVPSFACDDGTTVPEHWRCDGVDACDDGSDEADCDLGFQCGDGQRLLERFHCDGFPNCGDLSDETNCPETPLFVCADGMSLPEGVRCDGYEACYDGSDEQGCPERAQYVCPM